MKKIPKVRHLLFLLKPHWKYGKVYMIVVIAMAVLLTPTASVLATLLPQITIDTLMAGGTALEIISTVALFTLAIALIVVIENIITRTYTDLKSASIDYKIVQDVQIKALNTDYKYYDNPDFYNTFVYAQMNYASHAAQAKEILPRLLQITITAFAMGAIITQAGFVLLIITIAFVALQTALNVPQSKRGAEFSTKKNDILRPLEYSTRVMIQRESAAELRTSKAGAKMLRYFIASTDKFVDLYQKFTFGNLKYAMPQGVLNPIQSALILLYIVIIVIADDTTRIGLYASMSVAASTLASNIGSFFSNVNRLYEETMYGELIARFFEAKSEIEPPEANKGKYSAPEGLFDVEFKDVSFGYENSTFSIEKFNFKIPAGGRIAIVGENGAGKSTLTKLLLRLYDVDSGQVLIDERDIKEYDIHSLRLRIGIAYQDVRILAMSLRDNLTAYNDASDEELRCLVGKFGLDELLSRAEGDFDTMVTREFTEDGIVLSGGEAQRIALARLFHGSFGLLLLDEPSSALDPLMEDTLMNIILDKSNTATTIMVAHRLSTVRGFDCIYNVSDGKIIESGTHEELMDAKGKYFEMFTKQAANYQNDSGMA